MTDTDTNQTSTRRNALRAVALGGLAAVTIGLLARSRRGMPPAGCGRNGICRACPVLGSCRLDAARAQRERVTRRKA